MIRSYGLEGLRELVRNHVALAHELAGVDRGRPGIRVDGAGAVRAGLLSLPHPAGVAAEILAWMR